MLMINLHRKSYILPSGIIVLIDEDIDSYFNGTLVFYKEDEVLN